MHNKVTILMATFNGEKYISQQLDSIIKQTYSNWELWIRDDDSIDNTIKIVRDYMDIDDRIKLYQDEIGNLGCVENFATLLENTPYADYIMFSDQDDVWLPFKIEVTLEKMKDTENGTQGGVLVFTRFQKVDESLNKLVVNDYPLPKNNTIYTLISQTYIYGCTMMLNSQLIRIVNPISSLAECHDYWIALIASYHGSIGYLDQATLLYRQHANNVSGNYKDSSLKSRFNRIIKDHKGQILLKKNRLIMIESLIHHLKNKKLDVFFLEDYLKNINPGGIRAVYFILKYRLFKHGTGLGSNVLNIITSYSFRYKN